MSEKRNSRKSSKPQGKASTSPPANSPIDFGLLAQIVELMSANDLNTVDVRDGDRRVILKRGAAGAPIQMVQAAPVTAHAPAAISPAPASTGASPGAAAGADESGYLKITSPMVGTFYAAAKPGEKPLVSVGSKVTEETEVCLVEAMKNFMPVPAGCRGTIARIMVQDGEPVQFGTTLFLVSSS